MKALILRHDAQSAIATSYALAEKGFQILCVDTLAVAHALIRIDTVDLLVLDERVEGQLTHAIALSGERKNPFLSAIILTDRSAGECDDLYDLIPSLYALAGVESSAELIGKLAMSAVGNLDEIAARVARQAAIELAAHREIEEVALIIEPEMAMAKAPELAVEDIVSGALLLENAVLIAPDDDGESGAPAFADVAIAAPALEEAASDSEPEELERVEDAVLAEVAALFRSHPLSHLAGFERSAVAQAQSL